MNDKKHPIQLTEVALRRLKYEARKTPGEIEQESSPSFGLQTAHSPYDEETKMIQVVLRFGPNEDEDINTLPFLLNVEVIGFFVVDDQVFPKDRINAWAQENAPMLLLPYLREQVYSLSIRAGITPILLPLMQIPNFVMETDE